MSARNFHSVAMVAGIAATALGCYMVSLRVAAERVSLERMETRIVLAQRDIRSLQTEVGTRGRLAQLEKWNASVLALSAPDANQFLQGSFQLATLARPHDKVVDPAAPVVLASAPRPAPADRTQASDSAEARPMGTPSEMMHVASFKASEATATRPREAAPKPSPEPKKVVEKPPVKTAAPLAPVASAQAKAGASSAKGTAPLAAKSSARLVAKVPVKAVVKPAKVAAAPVAAVKDVKAKQ
jgi:hypothetical protein